MRYSEEEKTDLRPYLVEGRAYHGIRSNKMIYKGDCKVKEETFLQFEYKNSNGKVNTEFIPLNGKLNATDVLPIIFPHNKPETWYYQSLVPDLRVYKVYQKDSKYMYDVRVGFDGGRCFVDEHVGVDEPWGYSGKPKIEEIPTNEYTDEMKEMIKDYLLHGRW